MSRIFVGGFLSALVLVFAFQGVSAQRNVSVSEPSSESQVPSEPGHAECAVASCCQNSATEAVAEEPSLPQLDPRSVEQPSVEIADVADVADGSEADFPAPIVQVGGTQFDADPFSPRTAKKSAPALKFEEAGSVAADGDGFPSTTPEGDATAEEAVAPAMDRIWIMIHPEKGLQFLQTAEEVLLKKGQGAGTREFFLIDCEKFSMEGKLGEGKPEFVLTCEAFSLEGAFRTAKALEIKGAKLIYDTGRQELTLSGTEEAPVRVSIRDNDESKLQAQEIILKLNESSYQMQVSGANMELITVPARLQPTPANRSDDPLFGRF